VKASITTTTDTGMRRPPVTIVTDTNMDTIHTPRVGGGGRRKCLHFIAIYQNTTRTRSTITTTVSTIIDIDMEGGGGMGGGRGRSNFIMTNGEIRIIIIIIGR